MKSNKGFSLVEILIATTILGIIFLTIGNSIGLIKREPGNSCISWRDEVVRQENGEDKVMKLCNEYSNF